MEFNEFKKNLRPEKGSLPDGFDWNSMEKGIKEKMQKKKKRPYLFYFTFIIGMLGLIGISLLWKNTTATSTTDNSIKTKVKVENTKNDFIKKIESKKTIIPKEEVLPTTSPTSSNEKINVETTVNNITKHKIVQIENTSEIIPTEHVNVLHSLSSLGELQEERIVELEEVIKEPKELFEKLVKTNEEDKTISPIVFSQINLEEIKPLNIILNDEVNLTEEEFLFFAEIPSRLKNEIAITIGTNISKWNDDSTPYAASRNEYEKPLVSYQFNIDYKRFVNNHFFLKMGVNVSKNEFLFDYYGETKTNHLLSNVQHSVIIDTITNEVTVLSKDTLVEATLERTVKNYNIVHNINLPVFIGERWSNKNLFLEAEVGVLFNFITKTKGKLINPSLEIIDINDALVYKKNLGIAIGGGLNIGYQFSKRWDFRIGMNGMKLLSNRSEIEEVNLKPYSFGITSGIGFKF